MLQTAEDIRLLNEKISYSAVFIDKIHDEELFALTSQTKRAAVSIPSNLAEGTVGSSVDC